MKKKICLLLTLVVSIFMFSGKVEAGNIYMDCDYSCSSLTCGKGFLNTGLFEVEKLSGWDEFVIITNQHGDASHYALDGSIFYPLENDYDNGGKHSGCWLSSTTKGYNQKAACDSSIAYSDRSPTDVLDKKICPACLCRQPWFEGETTSGGADIADYFAASEGVPIGEGKLEKFESFEKTIYVVYKFLDSNGNERIFIEGYLGDETGKFGAYAFVGPHVDAFLWVDGIPVHQMNMLKKFGSDFWKVHEIDETRLIFETMDINGDGHGKEVNFCKGLSAEQCRNQHGYEVLFTSNDVKNKNSLLWELVREWYEQNSSEINEDNGGIFEIINNKNLNETCDNINSSMADGKTYSFSRDYDAEKLVSDLENAYTSLLISYEQGFSYKDYSIQDGKTDLNDSILTKLYNDVFGKLNILDLIYVGRESSESWKYHVNSNDLIAVLGDDLSYILEEYLYGDEIPTINITNINKYLNDYTLLYFTTASYMDSNPILFGLTAELADRVSVLRINFEKLVEKYELNMYPVVDCKGLLGQDLIDKINSYLDVIKIIIPIILIGMGVLDFTKAIFGGEDDMKKAQQLFMKRIGIAIIIFLTPTIVNLILNLANKVWPIISPNSCGLFE